MIYPTVLGEHATLGLALTGTSLARYGDGELRLAAGGWCTSQRAEKGIREELVKILTKPPKNLMPCIPNWQATPRKENWHNYAGEKFTRLYSPKVQYGSSFISRPDSAPWIDTDSYWEKVRSLWRNRSVLLVIGDLRSLRPAELEQDGAKVQVIEGPSKHAYVVLDRIEAQVLEALQEGPPRPVLICLGAAATCLAARLAAQGAHALDLGHMGMFMRHAGAYNHQRHDLISASYREIIRRKHKQEKWGVEGRHYADDVVKFAGKLGARVALDYGCGAGTLGNLIRNKIKVIEYDPGIDGKDHLPKPADLVVCTDVLEHIEPDKLDAVLDHIFRLAAKGVYLAISTRLANHELEDGRNAHLIVESPDWWQSAVLRASRQGWTLVGYNQRKSVVVMQLRRGSR